MLACQLVCYPYFQVLLRCPEPLTILLLVCKWAYLISLSFITAFWDKMWASLPHVQIRKWRSMGLNPSSGLFCIDKLLHILGTHSTVPHNAIFLHVYDLSSQLHFLKNTQFIGLSLGSPPPVTWTGKEHRKYELLDLLGSKSHKTLSKKGALQIT